MGNQCPAQPLRVMVLQDTQHLSASADAGLAPGTAVPEIDQQRQRLLAGRRNVECPLQHVDQVFDLLRAVLRVLFVW